jgi:ferric-dicitrate binding protein FerR (iron transport regulator)
MKLEVTHDVISDLCQSGDASVDSRGLVDAFLQQDPAFARTLKESEGLVAVVPRLRLSPDAERRLLDHARSRARAKLLVIGGTVALALVGLLLLCSLGAAMFVFAHRV